MPKVPILPGVSRIGKGPKLPKKPWVPGAAKGPKIQGVPGGPGGSGGAGSPRGGGLPHMEHFPWLGLAILGRY